MIAAAVTICVAVVAMLRRPDQRIKYAIVAVGVLSALALVALALLFGMLSFSVRPPN